MKKFEIKKNDNDLKLYMYNIQRNVQENFRAIMAYTDGDALNLILKEFNPGRVLINKKGEIKISKIIDTIIFDTQKTVSEQKEPAIAEFIYSMKLIADKYVENKRDQASLKRIINKIKIP